MHKHVHIGNMNRGNMNCFNLSWNLRKLCLCSIIQFLLSISRVNCKDKWKKLREGISSIDTLYMYVYLHVAIMTRERKNTFIHRFSLITWKLFMLLNLSYWKHISRVRKFVSNVFCSGVSPKKLLILQQVRLQALFVNISTFYMEKHYRFVIKGKIVLTTSD